MPYPQFDRRRLHLRPLAERENDLDLAAILPLDAPIRDLEDEGFRTVAARIVAAKAAGASVILSMGAHVIRAGVSRFIIDLMERGYLTHLAMNGAGPIHDFEFALIGATTESVARYIRTGEFGLWQETGRLNEAAKAAAAEGIGFGEAIGRMIAELDPPHLDVSLLAAGYRLGIPVTVHLGIGYDIIHEHPSADGAALGAASYADFLVYAHSIDGLEGGVFLNFGSAVMGPEVYLKALSMVRNVARREGREVAHFATAVFDLLDLGRDYHRQAPKTDPHYYYRPWKTILVRTVADGGESFYFQGDHRETFPYLWRNVRRQETGDRRQETGDRRQETGDRRQETGERHGQVKRMDHDRLKALLDSFPQVSIAVVGDFFLDRYLVIDPALEELSLETGLPAFQVVAKRCSPGAAGTVTNNLCALGVGTVYAMGCVGDDGEGYELRQGLRRTGVDDTHLLVRGDLFTPTYTKPMVLQPDGTEVESNRQDTRNRGDTPRAVIEAVIEQLRACVPKVQGVIVADQVEAANEGVITDAVREELAALAAAHPEVMFYADSRANIGRFRHLILKPNRLEACRAIDPEANEPPAREYVVECGHALSRRSGKPVYVTLGADGLLLATPDLALHIPGVAVEGPIDIVGAGDSTTAGIVSSLCAGASLEEAGLVGCLVASLTIQQLGTTGTASPEQVLRRFEESQT